MDNEEMEELFGQLRTAGYTPMPYETDIPTYTNRVHCGPATEVGDTNQENDDWYSQDMIERNRKFRIPAIGDSMQDAGINEGDELTVQTGITPMDGDILLVRLVDRFTVKAYYEDEDGQAWLVPYNDAYKPIKLGEKADYKVCGRVIEVARIVPRHEFLPSAGELQRMAVQSFLRPSRLWDENDAPVRGKRFRDYVMIADRTEELLMAA